MTDLRSLDPTAAAMPTHLARHHRHGLLPPPPTPGRPDDEDE
jgi:hypothetical protein